MLLARHIKMFNCSTNVLHNNLSLRECCSKEGSCIFTVLFYYICKKRHKGLNVGNSRLKLE